MLNNHQENLEDFINLCEDPQLVKKIVLDPTNINESSKSSQSVYWHDLSLMDGFPGFVVFFITLNAIFPEEKRFDLIAHRYILEIKSTIEKEGLSQNGSLFSGIAGLCYAISFASKERTRYGHMLSILEELLVRHVTEIYIPQIEEKINQRKPINFKLYDVIQGFTGIGLYLIKSNLEGKFSQLIEKLTQLSIDITFPLEYQSHLVPGWVCPAEFLHQKEDRLLNPFGIFNMGLSHGVPSLLGFMSIALKSGIKIPRQIKAMKTIIEWLKSKITKYEDAYFFQPSISFDQQVNNLTPKAKSFLNREAWCYGTPGVARTLYLAGTVLNDTDTINFAAKAFLSIFERSYEDWKLAGPTFCHGTAGVLLITYLMAKDLGSSFLSSKVKDLQERILNSHDETFPFGFRDPDLSRDFSYHPLDKAGLLTGSIGVWLSLLTTQIEATPNWYYPFMIDYA